MPSSPPSPGPGCLAPSVPLQGRGLSVPWVPGGLFLGLAGAAGAAMLPTVLTRARSYLKGLIYESPRHRLCVLAAAASAQVGVCQRVAQATHCTGRASVQPRSPCSQGGGPTPSSCPDRAPWGPSRPCLRLESTGWCRETRSRVRLGPAVLCGLENPYVSLDLQDMTEASSGLSLPPAQPWPQQ